MKQSDLRHWKWNADALEYRHARCDDVTVRHKAYGVAIGTTSAIGLPGLCQQTYAEVAAIAEHWSRTRCFAPDEDEPTVEQAHRWMLIRDWSASRGEWWGPEGSVHRVHFFPSLTEENFAKRIDAIALITQRPRAEIVREMLERK